MSNIFAQLLQEGDRQQKQLKPKEEVVSSQKPQEAAPPREDSMTVRQHAVTTARQHDSTLSRQQTSAQEYVQAFLLAKSTQKTTLRYPASLMTEIDDVIYQIKKTYGVPLSKNEIFLLGLANILFDFKRNADHSLLNEHLIRASKQAL